MDEILIPKRNLRGLQDIVAEIKNEIGKIIIGQDEVIDFLIASVIANGHVLIEGVPGVAKTLLAKILAKTISADFARIQFTPDLMPSDILGTSVFNLKNSEFEFNKGPIFSNIVLIDEINRSPAKTQAALFEVMEERQITADGKSYKMSEPFLVFATQNPIEHEGTYRLPEAELDRFLFKLEMKYPTTEQEIEMVLQRHTRDNTVDLGTVRELLTVSALHEYREMVREIHIERQTAGYIVDIISATRLSKDVTLGASPRASLALVSAAKTFAAMHGREFVTPDDIKTVAVPVLNHRILLSAEKEMEGATASSVLKSILEKIEVPR
ncbi:MAG: MoxR family ATPase [Ignavibacteria bacterium]|nr:MoxR family ATPase [Ignavibacteria bacterium]